MTSPQYMLRGSVAGKDLTGLGVCNGEVDTHTSATNALCQEIMSPEADSIA
jgi:hypothetical protein